MRLFTDEEKAAAVDSGVCPQCGESLVYPRNDTAYCEECGWPDSDFAEEEL